MNSYFNPWGLLDSSGLKMHLIFVWVYIISMMEENSSGSVFVTDNYQEEEKEIGLKVESSLLTPEARQLVGNLSQKSHRDTSSAQEAKVKVGSALSSLAFFYERVRYMVDYKGDHTLFRNAIERVSKRLLWENPARAMDTQRLAEDLVKELIWARYIKNDTFPKSKLKDISWVFEKYLKVLFFLSERHSKIDGAGTWRDWVMGVASSEIEEIIRPDLKRRVLLADAVSGWFSRRFDWKDSNLGEEDKKLQVQTAVYRSLYKSDLASVRYYLLKAIYPKWFEVDKEEIRESIPEFVSVCEGIEKNISAKVQVRIYRFVQKQVPSFLILSEILDGKDFDANLLSSREKLKEKVMEVCEEKYDEIKSRISRGIVRSVIYIFVTKMLFALLIEIPYDLVFDKAIRTVPVIINLTFPPLLMWMLGAMIKRPNDKNTEKIVETVENFVYGDRQEKIEFSLVEKSKNGFMYKFFMYLYAALFIAIFSFISFVLYRLHFSAVSALIFFGFLSLVLLFGFRVKHNSSELNVVGEDENLLTNFISIVSMPFLNVGVWLSSQLSKINFLIVIFDFLVEAPLKNILSVLEEWGVFMKEKKEEIIEVPTSN